MTVLDFIASTQELYNRSISKVCNKYELTNMEMAIILFLANNPQYDTATDIVNKRHLTKSHVSTSIRSLEEKNYLKKEYRNGDHRTYHLVLLPASKKMVKDGQKAQKAFLNVLTKDFTASELGMMQKYLQHVYDNVIKELSNK
ncbi:MAG: MarR family transcriptional regulator [Butyrivibrio sp.]|uniref:MarR family winged helix-turn-helix transcriptional regulator n=1 Tax=Butyrivibrio sp. TaxID=28121 RepID=UPI0025D91B11|nr:MarR family winged helix-turn-helix transcriptional regulator [Butyrivibrio sp.]MCR5770553.1 MarR family transcriptional regulator [Butyrivibrio sp.]